MWTARSFRLGAITVVAENLEAVWEALPNKPRVQFCASTTKGFPMRIPTSANMVDGKQGGIIDSAASATPTIDSKDNLTALLSVTGVPLANFFAPFWMLVVQLSRVRLNVFIFRRRFMALPIFLRLFWMKCSSLLFINAAFGALFLPVFLFI